MVEENKVVTTKPKRSKLKIIYYISLLFLVVWIIKATVFIVELLRKMIHGATQGVIFYPLLIIGGLIYICILSLNANDINLWEIVKEYFLGLFRK